MTTPENIRAISTGIIVEKVYGQTVEETTQAGLLLPPKDENDDDNFFIGQVTSIGAKVSEIKVGD